MNPMPYVWLFSIFATCVHLFSSRSSRKSNILTINTILLYQLMITVGLGSILNFYGHAFMSDKIADYIGWPPGNPFQYEVAFANLAFGVLGLLCYFWRQEFWLATILGISIWYLMDGFLHIYDFIFYLNRAPGNSGLPLYADFAIPALLLSLLYLSSQYDKN